MTAASFMTFVSSSDVTVSALLVCSNKGTVSSLAEEYSGDELTFFVVSLFFFMKTYLLMNKNY